MHRPTEELMKILAQTREQVKIGGQYQHFKTKGRYIVENIALQESTEEPCVVYRSSYSPELLWVRDVKIWNEMVEDENGNLVTRFSLIIND